MLPTVTMLTNQKCAAAGRLLALLLLATLAGCTPPGPRALLTGERLIQEGKFNEAIAPLTEATVLLPRNAQAWNHLGLASHNAGRANDALRAYRKALDVDVNLAAARFNLGCLLLEINQPGAAVSEFAAYTISQPKAVDGWLKRARAELLARQFDAAEKSYKAALALNPKQPEVWNTLGIVQLYRNRVSDSFQAFNQGVQQQSGYAPALFNAALVSHFYLPRRPVDTGPSRWRNTRRSSRSTRPPTISTPSSRSSPTSKRTSRPSRPRPRSSSHQRPIRRPPWPSRPSRNHRRCPSPSSRSSRRSPNPSRPSPWSWPPS